MLAVTISEVKLNRFIIKKKVKTKVQNIKFVIKEAAKSYELLNLYH